MRLFGEVGVCGAFQCYWRRKALNSPNLQLVTRESTQRDPHTTSLMANVSFRSFQQGLPWPHDEELHPAVTPASPPNSFCSALTLFCHHLSSYVIPFVNSFIISPFASLMGSRILSLLHSTVSNLPQAVSQCLTKWWDRERQPELRLCWDLAQWFWANHVITPGLFPLGVCAFLKSNCLISKFNWVVYCLPLKNIQERVSIIPLNYTLLFM